MRAWFGEVNDTIVTAANEPLARWAGSSDSEGLTKDIDLEAIAIKAGIVNSPEGYRRLLHETAIQVAREKISESLSGKDAYVMQAVKALDDVNDSYNTITERLTEWYGVHFPELRMRPQELIDLILRHGAKEASGHPNAATSIGAPMSQLDVAAVKGMAATAQALFNERKELEIYITGSMEELAPNLSGVLGPLLGARLIARAGGLEKLARMPASTIQVMGAGEALFKHLKEGTPSPKHGFIFKHPLISGSPKKVRGKVARMLAGKAAIAARMDYYSGERIDLGDLKAKVAAIKSRAGGKKKA